MYNSKTVFYIPYGKSFGKQPFATLPTPFLSYVEIHTAPTVLHIHILTPMSTEPLTIPRQSWRIVADTICKHLNIPHINTSGRSRHHVCARRYFVAYLRAMGYSGYRISQDTGILRSDISTYGKQHANWIALDPDYRREWERVRKAIDAAVYEFDQTLVEH